MLLPLREKVIYLSADLYSRRTVAMSFLLSSHSTSSLTMKTGKKTKDRVMWTLGQFANALRDAVDRYLEATKTDLRYKFLLFVDAVRRVPFGLILRAGSPFILYLVIFKFYTVLHHLAMAGDITPNTSFLPWLELTIFHCFPHRILAQHSHLVLDILAAIPYLVHFPLPFLFLLYLASNRHRRQGIYQYIWIAGWVNLVAVTIQFLWPTAPPWFVDSAVYDGVDKHLISSLPNEAGFQRLDAILGIPFFHGIYSQSPVKYGAFPSLHVAWPTVILVYSPWISTRFAVVHVAWITWAALYSNHHFAVDALGGILLVVIIHFMATRVWSPFREPIRVMDAKISGQHKHFQDLSKTGIPEHCNV